MKSIVSILFAAFTIVQSGCKGMLQTKKELRAARTQPQEADEGDPMSEASRMAPVPASDGPTSSATDLEPDPVLTLEEIPERDPTPRNLAPLCKGFLASIASESDFYQTQAKLRKQRRKEGHGRLLVAEAQKRGIPVEGADSTSTANDDCADILLSFERFANYQEFLSSDSHDINEVISNRIEGFRISAKRYPLSRCAAVISSLRNSGELETLQGELKRNRPASISPQAIMTSLLDAHHTAGKNSLGIEISARGCAVALRNFRSHEEIKEFTRAKLKSKIRQLRRFTTY